MDGETQYRPLGSQKMKYCPRCEETKSTSSFGRRSGKRSHECSSWCKECMADRARERYNKNPEKYIKKTIKQRRGRLTEYNAILLMYLSENPCVDCGETDPIVLEFDHVRGEKVAPVSSLVNSNRKWSIIEDEIDKCEIRCCNCHRRKTYHERDYTTRT